MSNPINSKYAFGKTLALGYEQAVARVTQELAKEGFGVLTEIDVAATLKKKLGKDMPPYKILGACNPQLAHRALEAEPQIGTLLPEDASFARARRALRNFTERSLVMKAKTLVAALLGAGLALGVPAGVPAQDRPAAKPRAGMQADPKLREQMIGRMKTMQAQMDSIRQTSDPKEREKLLAEHMKSMQEGMRMMRGMGGGMMGMMEQRMDMMQMMMEQMMQHQQMMQQAPR